MRAVVRGLPALPVLLALLLVPAAAGARAHGPCNGERRLCDRPLNEVVFPSAHNAMSAKSLGFQNPNQPVAFPAQLRAGIRGLLIDTWYGHRQADGTVVNDKVRTARSRMWFCHEVCQLGATPVVAGLRQIRRFLDRHPRNVIVIDHEDHTTPRDFVRAMRASGLARHAYRGRPGPRWPTLGTLIARRQQVVVLAEQHAGVARWYHTAYDGILQETPYTWDTPSLITRPANWASSCRPNRGGRHGSLFLLNHWSPSYPPSPANASIDNRASVLVGRARTCHRVRGRWPNLVAVDWFSRGALFRAVHRLNTLIAR